MMALLGQTVDVPLLPQDQQAPPTGSPAGRVKRITNGIATKYERDGRQALRVEKRNGFRRLDNDIRYPGTGGDLSDVFGTPDLLATFKDQLLSIDTDAVPSVRASTAGKWEKFTDETVLPRTLSQNVVFTGPAQASLPDGATVGGVHCYVWREGTTAFATIVDHDNTPLRTRFAVGSGIERVKVASDGSNFWIFTLQASTEAVIANVYSGATGEAISSVTVETMPNTPTQDWDVTHQAGLGVLWIGRRGSDVTTRLHILSISGVTITNTSVQVSDILSVQGIAFLLNDSGDSRAYVVACGIDEGAEIFRIHTLDATGVLTTDNLLNNDTGATPGYINATGYVVSTGGAGRQAVVFATAMPDESFQLDNYTRVMVQTLGSGAPAVEGQRVLKVGVASRAFRLDGNYYCAVYYSSVPSFQASFGSQLGQPTYFLLRMSATEGRVCGRWDYGKASMGWPELDTNPLGLGEAGRWHLGSTFVDTVTGSTHLPLGYSSSQQVVVRDASGISPVREFATSVGVKDIMIGAPGKAVEASAELLIPGAMAVSFTGGQFSEQGLNLAPEQATVTSTNNASGELVVGAQYEYVIVFEWTMANGDRARSQVSTPRRVTIASGHEAATLVGHSLSMTSRLDAVVSAYRTVWDPATSAMSTIHYKVTNDLDPLFNDPTADTWTFVDLMSDDEAALQEPLYTDLIDEVTGARPLQHDPCPAFTCGAIIDNRVIVAGYDGYLWVSGEKTPGEALWFNQDTLRIAMPTSDPMVGVAHLDSRIVIFCRRSIWWIPRGVFPDARGLGGALRAPERLPFENGSFAGNITSVRAGIIYDHSAGGVWLLSRDLNNVDVGAPAFDDLNGSTITGIVADQNGRVHVGISIPGPDADAGLLVFDTAAGTWYFWEWAGQVTKLCTWQGELVAATSSTIWLYAPGQYVDGVGGDDANSDPIITTLALDYVHLGKVKDFKRIWSVQLAGEWKGDHDLQVDVCFDDDPDRTAITTYAFTPDADEPYHFELPPAQELCSSMGFTISDSFPRTMGNASFAIELLSFYVALEKGLARVPPTVRRIVPTPGVQAPGGSVAGQVGGAVVSLDGVNTGLRMLSAYDASALRSGTWAYVATLRAHYWLDRAQVGAADGLFRVAAVGGGFWQRLVVPDSYWQAAYASSGAFLNRATGDDENAGTSPVTPLKTMAELRMRAKGLAGSLAINVLASSAVDDDGVLPEVEGTIYLQGTTTVVASGTLTASTPTLGNDRYTVADTARANWTGLLSTASGTRWIRKATGAVRAAMISDAGSGAAVIIQPTDAPPVGPYGFDAEADDFVGADAYEIYSVFSWPMPQLQSSASYLQTFCLDFSGRTPNVAGAWTPILCGFLGITYVDLDSVFSVALGCVFMADLLVDGIFNSSFCAFRGKYLTTRAVTFDGPDDPLVNYSFPPAGDVAIRILSAHVALGIWYVWGATAACLSAEAGATVAIAGLRGEDNTGRLVSADRSVVYGGGGITATTSESNDYELNGTPASAPPGADGTNGGAIFA